MLGLTFFVGIFAMAQALLMPYGIWLDYRDNFNVYFLQDSSVFWLLCFGLLPFGFNSLFCFFIGMFYSRVKEANYNRSLEAEITLPRKYVFNIGLIWLLVWWLIFNLPNYSLAWQAVREEPGLSALKSVGLFLMAHWPPASYPNPLPLEFLLFYPMGNLAIISGFTLGVFYQDYPE